MTEGGEAELNRLAIGAIIDPDHTVKVDVAAWARENLGQHDLVAHDRESTFAADDWMRCAERGILGLLVPAEYGGRGGDLVTALLTLEGLGLGCSDNGLTFAIASQVMSTQVAIERFGSEEQKRRWLPPLCDGSALGVFAITEHESGSDAYAMAATAIPHDDGTYVLNGTKAHLTLGSRADVVVVFASTKPEAGRWGLSAFVVPADLAGVDALGNREKMGMRTTPFGDIAFHDVVVTDDMRLGPEGAGASIFTSTLEAERGFVFATQIGMMERQLDESIDYAKTRQQGGHPIGEYQAVSHRIADMKMRHETARLHMYKTALDVINGRPATMSAALSKLVASESALESSLAASAVHGARGYVSEYEIERNLRDAIGGIVYSGTSDVQRNIIARLLGLGSGG
jgi:alkylation response protein AidB-like acyl-CoA dehydrogenase